MPDSARSRVRWILIGWIFLVGAVSYLDRVNLGIAGKWVMADFHLDKVQLGLIQSAFVLGYALFQVPAGWLADRIGPRRILALGVIWWGIFTCLITVVPLVGWVLLILISIRFGLGAGEAVVYPASNKIVAAWIPSDERGLANGFIFTGVGFGAGVTPPLIAFIVVNYGWRASFWCSALIGVAVGAVWYLLARDTPREHPWVSTHEHALIEAGLPPVTPGSNDGRLAWREIFGDRDLVLVTLSYFTYGYAAFIFFSWFFIYLNDVRGLDLRHSALWSMLPFLAMAGGSSGGGWLSDIITRRSGKRAGRCWLAAVGIGLAAVFIAAGTLAASTPTAVIVLAAGAGALYISQSSFWSVSADIGKKSAGSVSGLMNMGAQMGSVFSGSLTPFIGKYLGWNMSFLVAAVLCAGGAVAWFFVSANYGESRERGPIRQTIESLS